MEPLLGFISPMIVFSRVDFPLPFGPTMQSMSPSSTLKERFSIILLLSYFMVRSFILISAIIKLL